MGAVVKRAAEPRDDILETSDEQRQEQGSGRRNGAPE
jgi:hypothetical protein